MNKYDVEETEKAFAAWKAAAARPYEQNGYDPDRFAFFAGYLARKAKSIAEVEEEREACAQTALNAMNDGGTDNPHATLEWAASDIRKRGDSEAR